MHQDINAIYVQKSGGEFINETAFSMWNGCKLLGLPVETFEENSFKHIILDRSDVVHGYVRIVKQAFNDLGIASINPNLDGDPPECLHQFFKRKLWKSTIGKLKLFPKYCFIKPLNESKFFSGFIFDGISGLIKISAFPDDLEILCSEVVDFVSEYRCFVHNGLLVDVRRYGGNITKFVDVNVALDCIKTFSSAPISYSIDLGLTTTGETVIVELNDAYSLGGYGIDSTLYVKMIIDRWFEIVNTN